MKKITQKKLHVNGETLRALATHELTRVVGGWDSGVAVCGVQADSGADVCVAQAALGTKVGG